MFLETFLPHFFGAGKVRTRQHKHYYLDSVFVIEAEKRAVIPHLCSIFPLVAENSSSIMNVSSSLSGDHDFTAWHCNYQRIDTKIDASQYGSRRRRGNGQVCLVQCHEAIGEVGR